MDITIIKNRPFRPTFLQNLLTPRGKLHFSTARIGNTLVLVWELLVSKLLDIMNSIPWNSLCIISRWYQWRDDRSQRFQRITLLKAAHPGNDFPRLFGESFRNCQPVSYRYLPPWHTHPTQYIHTSTYTYIYIPSTHIPPTHTPTIIIQARLTLPLRRGDE